MAAAAENSDDAAPSDDDEEDIAEEAPKDDEFFHALRENVRACPAYSAHAELLEECCEIAGVTWRARFWEDKALWKRIRRGKRLAKELSEIAPVLARAREAAASFRLSASGKRLVILDLCSGFGYLAMFLSELLAPWADKVEKIVLVDVRWAPHNVAAGPQHLNPRHLLAAGWPIRMTTSRANLKAPSDRRGLARTFLSHGHPAWLLGVHLCGTLSLRAVDMFNDAPSIVSFALKPCCVRACRAQSPGLSTRAAATAAAHVSRCRFPFCCGCSCPGWCMCIVMRPLRSASIASPRAMSVPTAGGARASGWVPAVSRSVSANSTSGRRISTWVWTGRAQGRHGQTRVATPRQPM